MDGQKGSVGNGSRSSSIPDVQENQALDNPAPTDSQATEPTTASTSASTYPARALAERGPAHARPARNDDDSLVDRVDRVMAHQSERLKVNWMIASGLVAPPTGHDLDAADYAVALCLFENHFSKKQIRGIFERLPFTGYAARLASDGRDANHYLTRTLTRSRWRVRSERFARKAAGSAEPRPPGAP
jgi:hypothetical protein